MGHKMCTSKMPHCSHAKSAHTRLLVLEIGLYDNSPATKVLLKPITGRRHQLRVHCSSLGHTIVGDFSYSNQKDILPYRMFLHAQRLVLPNRLEVLDVRTDDPFVSRDRKNKWKPLKVLNVFDEAIYDRISTSQPAMTIGPD